MAKKEKHKKHKRLRLKTICASSSDCISLLRKKQKPLNKIHTTEYSLRIEENTHSCKTHPHTQIEHHQLRERNL